MTQGAIVYDGSAGTVTKQPVSHGINLNKRIRANHPLRKVIELIDFDFVYDDVKDC